MPKSKYRLIPVAQTTGKKLDIIKLMDNSRNYDEVVSKLLENAKKKKSDRIYDYLQL